MESQLKALQEQQAYTIVPVSEVPADSNILNNMYVFKLKTKADGTIDKYKASGEGIQPAARSGLQ